MLVQAIASAIASKAKIHPPQQAMTQRLQGQQQRLSTVMTGVATSRKQTRGHAQTIRTISAMVVP